MKRVVICKPATAMKCILVLALSAPVLTSGWSPAQGPLGRDPQAPKSSIRWKNELFSAEFTSVPIRNLITDLLSYDGSKWKVDGDLRGIATLCLEKATLEEGIRAIMRSQNYNYTLVSSRSARDTAEPHVISELTIYQGDAVVRFSKLSPGTRASLSNAPASNPAQSERASTPAPPPSPMPAGMDKQAVDREIRAFMDQMLAEKKISREEYGQALREMQGLQTAASPEMKNER